MSQLNMTQFPFLPSIDIRQMSPDPNFVKKFDLGKGKASQNALEQLVDINSDKLRNYIETNIAIGHKVDGILSYHVVPFIQCNESDFSIMHDKSFLNKVKTRICPDFKKLEEIWKVSG